MSESGGFPIRPNSGSTGARPKSGSTGSLPKSDSSQEQPSCSAPKNEFKQRAVSPIRKPVSHFETGYLKRPNSAKLPFKKNWNRSMAVGSERRRAAVIAQPPSRCDFEAGPSLAEIDTNDDSIFPTQELSKCRIDSSAVNPMPIEFQAHCFANDVPLVINPMKSLVQQSLSSSGHPSRRPRLAMNSVNRQKTFATYHSVQINLRAEDSSRPKSVKHWNPASEQSISAGPEEAAVPISEVDKIREELFYEKRMVTLIAKLRLGSLYDSFNKLIKNSSDDSIDERRNLKERRSAREKDSLRIGEEICTLKPFVFMLFNAQIRNYCSFCVKPMMNRPRQCGSCKALVYCDKLCQTWHWKMHARECKYYEKHSPRWPDDFQRMVILLICKLKAGDAENDTSEYIHGRQYTYQDLCPGLETLGESYAAVHIQKSYEEIKSFLEEDMVTYEEYLTIYGKFFRNMVYINKANKEDIGIGLYLGLAAFNHSCRPMANLVFEGVEAVLIACKDMESRYTEQMTFNRIRHVLNRTGRLQTLNEHYYTSCNCAVCEDKDFEEKITEVHKPERANGPGGLTEKVSQLLTQLPLIHPDHQMQILCLADGILKEMTGVYGPMNALRCEALEYACRACTVVRRYEEAKFFYSELLKIYKFYYGLHHPKSVESLFRLAEAYFETKCSPEANALYACALSNTLLTFGENHSFYFGARETYKHMERNNFDCGRFN